MSMPVRSDRRTSSPSPQCVLTLNEQRLFQPVSGLQGTFAIEQALLIPYFNAQRGGINVYTGFDEGLLVRPRICYVGMLGQRACI